MLVISKKILEPRQFDGGDSLAKPIKWPACSLRTWLNNDFYEAAFTEEEKEGIVLTLIKTPDLDTEYETLYVDGTVEKAPVFIPGAKDTEDRVFCLSVEEAEKYFFDDMDRIATISAAQQDLDYIAQIYGEMGWDQEDIDLYYSYTYGGIELNKTLPMKWWLRQSHFNVTYVHQLGSVYYGSMTGDGDKLPDEAEGVRPAMWLKMDAVEIDITIE